MLRSALFLLLQPRSFEAEGLTVRGVWVMDTETSWLLFRNFRWEFGLHTLPFPQWIAPVAFDGIPDKGAFPVSSQL